MGYLPQAEVVMRGEQMGKRVTETNNFEAKH